jgi:hypothetical protein
MTSQLTIPKYKGVTPHTNFHSWNLHFDDIKSFICPTNAQLNCFKILKFTLRFTINAPTCFGLTKTIIRRAYSLCLAEVTILVSVKILRYIGCPTRYRTRHFYKNFTTNADFATKFEEALTHCVRNVKEKNVLLFKILCNIFIGFRIIKEMPGSVASGTSCRTVRACGRKTTRPNSSITKYFNWNQYCNFSEAQTASSLMTV